MVQTEPLQLLTPDRRLALSYAPRSVRGAWLVLYALDARLEAVVRSVREPLIGQLKLAWWRERIAEAPERRPRGEPLLAELAVWGKHAAALSALVDAWELQLGEDPAGTASIRAFALARGKACEALARQIGAADPAMANQAGQGWALLDIAALQGPSPALRAVSEETDWQTPVLPRSLRPLLIHFGLARRARPRDFAVGGLGDLLLAMRLGLLGI
jgi:phytoene synthase